MNIDIQVKEDENFKLVSPVAEVVEEIPEQPQVLPPSGPKPAPIQNKVYSGTGWFEGTPWSTNNR